MRRRAFAPERAHGDSHAFTHPLPGIAGVERAGRNGRLREAVHADLQPREMISAPADRLVIDWIRSIAATPANCCAQPDCVVRAGPVAARNTRGVTRSSSHIDLARLTGLAPVRKLFRLALAARVIAGRNCLASMSLGKGNGRFILHLCRRLPAERQLPGRGPSQETTLSPGASGRDREHHYTARLDSVSRVTSRCSALRYVRALHMSPRSGRSGCLPLSGRPFSLSRTLRYF
jgi:hypothetical protein